MTKAATVEPITLADILAQHADVVVKARSELKAPYGTLQKRRRFEDWQRAEKQFNASLTRVMGDSHGKA